MLNIEVNYKISNKTNIEFASSITPSHKYKSLHHIPLGLSSGIEVNNVHKVSINFKTPSIISLGNSNWIVNQSDEESLQFLALNN